MAHNTLPGFGSGEGTRAYATKRKKDHSSVHTGFRARIDNEAAYFALKAWCDHPDINVSFSAVINCILPGLKVAIEQTTEIHPQTKRVSIELNLGRITITQ